MISSYYDIKGSVVNPGVYEIKKDMTINDAIIKAGGLTKNANTSRINLSKKIKDEMVIYVFSKADYIIKTCNCPLKEILKCKEIPIVSNTNNIEKSTITTSIDLFEEKKQISTTAEKMEYSKKENEKENEKEIKQDEITTQTNTTKEIEITTKSILININIATIDELIKINGLGIVKAESIVKYRNENGLFEKIEDITKVNGIGNSTFEKIKEYITI